MLGFDMIKSRKSQKDGRREEIKLITSSVSVPKVPHLKPWLFVFRNKYEEYLARLSVCANFFPSNGPAPLRGICRGLGSFRG